MRKNGGDQESKAVFVGNSCDVIEGRIIVTNISLYKNNDVVTNHSNLIRLSAIVLFLYDPY
jgi:hypothetical protein